MAFTRTQAVGQYYLNTITNFSLTNSSAAIGAGDLLVLLVGLTYNSFPPSSVTDNVNGTWTAGPQGHDSIGSTHLAWYYKEASAPAAINAMTITVHIGGSGSNQLQYAQFASYSGGAGVGCYEASIFGENYFVRSTTPSVVSGTPGGPGRLILLGCVVNDSQAYGNYGVSTNIDNIVGVCGAVNNSNRSFVALAERLSSGSVAATYAVTVGGLNYADPMVIGFKPAVIVPINASPTLSVLGTVTSFPVSTIAGLVLVSASLTTPVLAKAVTFSMPTVAGIGRSALVPALINLGSAFPASNETGIVMTPSTSSVLIS